MRYMMLIHHDEAALAAAPQKELWAEYGAFNEALSKAGAGMGSGERLQPNSAATTVRQENGKTEVLDGPYADTYDHLVALTRSPVVVLNRAIALAEVEGAEPALNAIAPLGSDKRMIGYQPYWAARGHLLARAGERTEAAEAFTVAIGLSTDEAVRAYLRSRLAALPEG